MWTCPQAVVYQCVHHPPIPYLYNTLLVEMLWSLTGIRCVVPSFPNYNISDVAMEYFVGDNLMVKCRDGYKLIGQDVLTCSNSSQWTPQVPHCTRIGEDCV